MSVDSVSCATKLPWLEGSPLISLWDIMRERFKPYAGIISAMLVQLERELTALNSMRGDSVAPKEHRDSLENIAQALQSYASELNLMGTMLATLDLSQNSKLSGEVNLLKGITRGLIITTVHELNLMRFYPVDQKRFIYTSAEPFGPLVAGKFKSAKHDISEAGLCFACERYTATVMHCMRVLEFGLDALGAELAVNRGHSGWGRDLGNFISKWDQIVKASKPGSLLGWKRELIPRILSQLQYFETAWRNHAMHAHKEYGELEATRVIEHVMTFMQLVSSKMKEPRKKRIKSIP